MNLNRVLNISLKYNIFQIVFRLRFYVYEKIATFFKYIQISAVIDKNESKFFYDRIYKSVQRNAL